MNITVARAETRDPGLDEMTACAAALTPVLAERADHVENTRMIHPDTVRDFWDTRIWSILKPRRYGGLQLSYHSVIDIPDHIARGCASTAWIYSNLISHDWMLGMWPAEAQDAVWKDNPEALIASSLVATGGCARKVTGGYELSGRWPFCSGIDPSDWMMMGAMIEDDGPRRPLWLVVPRDRFEEIDTWHVSGLVGSGSRDVASEDIFVPEHMTLEPHLTRGGPTPGSSHVPGILYELPVLGLFPHILVGPILGIAQGAYDDYVAEVRRRSSTANNTKLAEHTQIQMKVAEAATLIQAARLLAHDNIREAEHIAGRDDRPPLEAKMRWRRDGAFAAQNCLKAVQLLHSIIGGAGNYLSHPFQRRLRDMNAAIGQTQVNFDINGAEFGRVTLGLEAANKAV